MRFLYIILMMCLCQFSKAQTRLDYFLTEATESRMQGQWSRAFDLYSHCLEIDSCSPEALFQLGRMYFYLRQDSVGLDYMYRSVELDSRNVYYIEPLAAILLRQGCEDEALPLLERISELQGGRSDVLSHLSNIYARMGRLEDAINALDRLEVQEGKMSQLSNEKFNLYMQMGDSVSAFAEIQSLCDEYPADLYHRVNMGSYYLQLGNFEKALEIYDQVRLEDPKNIPLQMAMLDYYIMVGKDSLYESTRDSILYSQETETDKRVVLIQQMIQRMSTDSADVERINERFEKVIHLDSTNVELLTMYAAFIEYSQRPKETIRDLMLRVLAQEPDNEMATQWLLQYYVERTDYASIEEICRRGVNYHPKELLYSYFLGMILCENEKYDEALSIFERGLRMRSEDTRRAVISDAFAAKGDVHYKLGRYNEAYLDYDSALVYNKENVLCMNNYAYYLSLRNENLDKAEEMSYRTIKAEPDNRVYLDTYAWILFMKGKYQEAQPYMEKVVPRDSTEEFLLNDEHTSSVILEHAGDIAWMCGDQLYAVYLWELAVKRGDDNATPMLYKKAKKRKYYKGKVN